MTRDEMKLLVMGISASYPNWKIDNPSLTIDTWFKFLGHYEYSALSKAVESYIMSDTSGFAPSIGKINDLVNSIAEQIEGETLNDMQAWSLVANALRKSGWHSKEAFAELPPLVQKAVGSADNLRHWATDDDYKEGVVMSQFMTTYRGVVKQASENRRLPLDVQHMIAEKEAQYLKLGGGAND